MSSYTVPLNDQHKQVLKGLFAKPTDNVQMILFKAYHTRTQTKVGETVNFSDLLTPNQTYSFSNINNAEEIDKYNTIVYTITKDTVTISAPVSGGYRKISKRTRSKRTRSKRTRSKRRRSKRTRSKRRRSIRSRRQ